ncbi:glycosyl transferase family 2 [Vibrio cholerae]|uniref:glycosyltransferase family 2 protein n=1 Tax=Vibrio cholerae TaxID=666 RepID=UPI001E5328A7|nr:glycosyltransferase family 2 protein [Vibrio cholerae]MCD1171498.1 glycosyl transferase family 2 [Vibrio cholerae]
MPKISVIIPVYNVAPYVKEAIFSVLDLQVDNSLGDVKFEVIIVDDCSTDNTFEICNKINDERIKTFKNKCNLKICKTLNYALTHASGDLILRMDGDDVSLPSRLTEKLAYMHKHNLDVVGCQMIAIDEAGNQLAKGSMPIGVDKIKAASKFASPIAHIWLAKREVYETLNGYREIPYAEDYDFILRALDKGFRCDNTPEHLMLIRQRSGNTASTASLKQRKTHKYVLELHKRRIKNNSDEDGFSEGELADRIYSWPITEKLHLISTKFLTSAYHEKNKIKKLVKVLSACVLSYYNFEYLLSRIRFRKSFM